MSLMTWSVCFAALYKRFKLQQYAAPTVLLLAANNFTPIHAFYYARNSATNFILLIYYKCVLQGLTTYMDRVARAVSCRNRHMGGS